MVWKKLRLLSEGIQFPKILQTLNTSVLRGTLPTYEGTTTEKYSEEDAMRSEFDLVVIGGGSAGFAAAIKAVERGAKVAVVEVGTIGGTCLNRGCIPSKNLLHAAWLYHLSCNNPFPGITLPQGKLDFRQVMEQKDALISDLREKKYLSILREYDNIHLFNGKAEFTSRDTVIVDKDRLVSERFIVATGSSPSIIPIKGLDKVQHLTSKEVLELQELSGSIVILGGRAVALESAQTYAHFGAKVTILQRSPRIIPDHEEELSLSLRECLEEEGIEIHTDTAIHEVEKEGEDIVIQATVNKKPMVFRGSKLLMATGRRPNTNGMGLERVGVELDYRGAIKVDEEMATSAPNVWAAGDVTGKTFLVTMAAHEGAVAAQNALDCCSHVKVDYTSVPYVIFTTPNVATVGLTEEGARKKGLRVKAKSLDMKMVPKAQVIRDTRGMVKMVVEEDTNRILGVHILSSQGAEIIHEAVLAIKFGLTLTDLIETIYVYPTISECLKIAAQSFFKDVNKLSCCAE